jgi:sigma-54 dependent transcriptional regulator, acetoin dehydrogenase operon transcriptional activator AcoR
MLIICLTFSRWPRLNPCRSREVWGYSQKETVQAAYCNKMKSNMQTLTHSPTDQRLRQIALARRAVLHEGKGMPQSSHSWIERSWHRALASGKRPDHQVSFDVIAPTAMRRLVDANHTLVSTARPVLESLSRAIAGTRYFAVLTDAQGVVIDAHGPIDRSDRRADLITRIGTDLSESRLATTAISAALTELQPVWLHRGEHFFDANSAYSCAGAPLFGPEGTCIGMLDLTGIDAAERPELKHLVAQSARSIENALTMGRLLGQHDLLVRVNWPGRTLGDETDGLVCLNADGYVTAANQMARLMVPQLLPQLIDGLATEQHASDLFAMPYDMLFDAAKIQSNKAALEVPLWTGLRLLALPVMRGQTSSPRAAQQDTLTKPPPLKDIETALIRQAVDEARGNVQKAAKTLGISRATVYRRLGSGVKRH